jgi:hypothetical protein
LSQHLDAYATAGGKGADAATPLLAPAAGSQRRLGFVCGGRVPIFVACYFFEAIFFALIAAAVVASAKGPPSVAGAVPTRASPPPAAPSSPPAPAVPVAVAAPTGAVAGAPAAARSMPSLSLPGLNGFDLPSLSTAPRRAGMGTPPPPAPWDDDHMFGR